MESNKSPIEIKPRDEVSQDDINLALISHVGTMFGGFFVPLIIWIIKKDESKFVAEHARNSLNFQLSMLHRQLLHRVVGDSSNFYNHNL